MTPMLLQLSIGICLAIVIRLASSQSTHDVIREENDVTSCGRTEQALNQLMKAVSQLQRDVAELKTDKRQKDARGIR